MITISFFERTFQLECYICNDRNETTDIEKKNYVMPDFKIGNCTLGKGQMFNCTGSCFNYTEKATNFCNTLDNIDSGLLLYQFNL